MSQTFHEMLDKFQEMYTVFQSFSKKKVVILLQSRYVDGQVITPNLFTFFMVPIHPNLQRNFFLLGG